MAKITQLASVMRVSLEYTEKEVEILEAIFSYDLSHFVKLADKFGEDAVKDVIRDMRSEMSRAKRARDSARKVLSGEYEAVQRKPQ